MKTLYVLRHAKSSWDNDNLSDFERPLNPRGSKAAPLMGETMRKNEFVPDLILSSPAERARETAELVKKAANFDAPLHFDERIYEASPTRILEVLSEQHENLQSILLVGHNPGIEGLLRFFTGEIQSMPTAALAVIDVETDWKDIVSAEGKLRILLRPKELE